METDRRTPFSDEELAEFRALIEAKRDAAVADIDAARAQLTDSQQADNDSTYSVHMADAGTDAAGRESLYQSIGRLQAFVGHLDRALGRIDNKTYGVCRITGEPIPKERLRAVPHTETTVAAKLDEQRRR